MGLRVVRTVAVTSFKQLQEEEKRIHHTLPQKRQNRGVLHHLAGEHGNYEDQSPHGNLNYSDSSQAETTLARHGVGGGASSKYNFPTGIGRDSKPYPFNPEDLDYLSKFQIRLRGCFKCGSMDHFRKEQCPIANERDRAVMDQFHQELKIHKPHMWDSIRSPVSIIVSFFT